MWIPLHCQDQQQGGVRQHSLSQTSTHIYMKLTPALPSRHGYPPHSPATPHPTKKRRGPSEKTNCHGRLPKTAVVIPPPLHLCLRPTSEWTSRRQQRKVRFQISPVTWLGEALWRPEFHFSGSHCTSKKYQFAAQLQSLKHYICIHNVYTFVLYNLSVTLVYVC